MNLSLFMTSFVAWQPVFENNMAFTEATTGGWHEGEEYMHTLLKVPGLENPTSLGMTPFAEYHLRRAPLLAVGALDDEGRPWTTLWGGKPGFTRSLGQSVIGLRTMVDDRYDPVLPLLALPRDDIGELSTRRPKPVSALSIDLATRTRVKLSGEVMAGAVEENAASEGGSTVAEAQVIIAVKSSLGNCPKYLNAKKISSAMPSPTSSIDTFPLGEEALGLIAKADLFFITSHHHRTLGTNHRGGPSGFVRVLQNDPSAVVLVYPEYSGNRFYQTLGNLKVNSKAGVVIPNFDSGDVLYFTCETEIVVGNTAVALLPKANLAVKLKLTAARLVPQGLALRAQGGEPSPYNPTVWYTSSERSRHNVSEGDGWMASAQLVAKDVLTPKIARLRFKLNVSDVAKNRKPGQYAIFHFEDELSLGYSHMRNDDPKSLNDDFVRSFTISSSLDNRLPIDEFEITIRDVGKATHFLFTQQVRNRFELPIRGFSGDFHINASNDGYLPYVAGGIGVTPLLAFIPRLDLTNLRLFWTVRADDLGLVGDTFTQWPKLAFSTLVFITSTTNAISPQFSHQMETLKKQGPAIHLRRMTASDLVDDQSLSQTWYICTGNSMRRTLLGWLVGKAVVYEDFDY